MIPGRSARHPCPQPASPASSTDASIAACTPSAVASALDPGPPAAAEQPNTCGVRVRSTSMSAESVPMSGPVV